MCVSNQGVNTELKGLKSVQEALFNYGLYDSEKEIKDPKKLEKIRYAQSCAWQEYLKENDFPLSVERISLKPKEVVKAIKKARKATKNYLWKYMIPLYQYIESEIAVQIMLEQIKDGLITWTVHDGLIVPKEYAKKYKSLLEKLTQKIISENRKAIRDFAKIANLRFQTFANQNKTFTKIPKNKILKKILENNISLSRERREEEKNKKKNIFLERRKKRGELVFLKVEVKLIF